MKFYGNISKVTRDYKTMVNIIDRQGVSILTDGLEYIVEKAIKGHKLSTEDKERMIKSIMDDITLSLNV